MKTFRVLLFLLVAVCPTTTNIYANELCGITGMGYVCRPCDPVTESECPRDDPSKDGNTAGYDNNQISPVLVTDQQTSISHNGSETLIDYLFSVFW
jgi:hypothetical protein